MGNGDWPCYGTLIIDNQVSLTGPQPWDVVCKNKHHPECVVLPTTLGNVPVMPRYYCRGRSHDITPLYLAGTVGFLRRVLFQVAQAGDFFEIVLAPIFFYIWASFILFHMYAFRFSYYILYISV